MFEAVLHAMRFFADPYWRGPKPDPCGVFKVALVGEAGRVREIEFVPLSSNYWLV